jgi:tight adherence protein B
MALGTLLFAAISVYVSSLWALEHWSKRLQQRLQRLRLQGEPEEMLALSWREQLEASVLFRKLTRRRRLEEMRLHLPELLDELAQTLRAGLSLRQSIERKAQSTTDPALAALLQSLAVDFALGYSVSEALERFRQRTPLKELRTVSLALDLQHRTGGDVATMLEQSAALTRQSLQLMRSLRAQTAQGRLSVKLIVAVPLGLVALLSLAMPGYIGGFLGSSLGQFLLLAAFLLLTLGFFWVRKVMTVDV